MVKIHCICFATRHILHSVAALGTDKKKFYRSNWIPLNHFTTYYQSYWNRGCRMFEKTESPLTNHLASNVPSFNTKSPQPLLAVQFGKMGHSMEHVPRSSTSSMAWQGTGTQWYLAWQVVGKADYRCFYLQWDGIKPEFVIFSLFKN